MRTQVWLMSGRRADDRELMEQHRGTAVTGLILNQWATMPFLAALKEARVARDFLNACWGRQKGRRRKSVNES